MPTDTPAKQTGQLTPVINEQVQVVSKNYLEAVLSRLSMTAHRYRLHEITQAFCTVAYSNPDQCGVECPVYLRLPVYRIEGGIRIVLETHSSFGGRSRGEQEDAEESFSNQIDALPALYRDPESLEWGTYEHGMPSVTRTGLAPEVAA